MVEEITSIASPLYFGENILESHLLPFCQTYPGKKVLIVDRAIQELYGDPLARHLGAELLSMDGGEKGKNKATLERLETELFQRGCNRDLLLLALGGGVTLDLVGFLASIYLRGVPLVFIPTTLLAMVDASIGGKTAIDTPFGKNLLGTLYHPQAIFTDLRFLKTLPEKEWVNGQAEILKMGLIFDASLWELAGKNKKDPQLIFKAIQGKIRVVAQDPTDQGIRRILNFGHTIGHALEKGAEFEMAHGEAVAIGCVVEAYLSAELGYLSRADLEQIQISYRSFSHMLPKRYDRAAFLKALTYDKKRISGKARFVLIDQIGHAIPFDGRYCREVEDEALKTTLDWMEKTYG